MAELAAAHAVAAALRLAADALDGGMGQWAVASPNASEQSSEQASRERDRKAVYRKRKREATAADPGCQEDMHRLLATMHLVQPGNGMAMQFFQKRVSTHSSCPADAVELTAKACGARVSEGWRTAPMLGDLELRLPL